MKDVFYTLLAVWVVWRIIESVNWARSKQKYNEPAARNEGKTTVTYVPQKEQKMKFPDGEGEYVDYEEVK